MLSGGFYTSVAAKFADNRKDSRWLILSPCQAFFLLINEWIADAQPVVMRTAR